MSKRIEELRKEIDLLDEKMGALLEERMRMAVEIGCEKRREHAEVTDSTREEEVARRVENCVSPVYRDSIRPIYQGIMAESKRLQGRRFALLGARLSYSISPAIYAEWGIDYVCKEVNECELEVLLTAPTENDCCDSLQEYAGYNVTIPYKETVVPYLVDMDDYAQATGVVNTLVHTPKGWMGYNTDCLGIRATLAHENLSPAGKVVCIIGCGASAKSVCKVVTDMKASKVYVVSRHPREKRGNAILAKMGAVVIGYDEVDRASDASLLFDTTPLGTYPNIDEQSVYIEYFHQLEGVIDLCYNPPRSKLLLDAEWFGIKAVNGLYMLVSQAWENANLWGFSPQGKEEVYHKLKRTPLVLVGMPGAGKTTIGREVAKVLHLPFVDTDEEIERRTGSTAEQWINEKGEQAFREVESKVLFSLLAMGPCVIATGGGAVCERKNRDAMREFGRVVLIKRDLDALSIDGRPISRRVCPRKLWEERRKLYHLASDDIVDNEDMTETINKIVEYYKSL